MNLEKTISFLGKKISNGIKILSLAAVLVSCPTPNPEEENKKYSYTTTITPVESQEIDSETGGIIEITNPNSLIYGTKLTIPSGALQSDTTISIGEVNNPPVLPAGLNYVGTPVSLDSDGINFNNSLTIQIPYSDSSLSDAGLSEDSNLKLFSYDENLSAWNELSITALDTDNNLITAKINHFSYYTITGFSCPIPEDLGVPQPGDLLYSLGAVWDKGNPQLKDNWMPGHVGIYVGEKTYSSGLATDNVERFRKYNVVEALPGGVRFSYYDIPKVKEIFENSLSSFSGINSYAGAREPKDFILTQEQREDIVSYVEARVGKEYAFFETSVGALFGLARGSLVKGNFGRFNCVGLAEAAYEYARVNNGDGLVSWFDEEWPLVGPTAVLTPAEQYKETKPAIGSDIIPIVTFTSSDSQIAIMNEDGTNIQEITSGPLEKNYPRSSADRKKIIFEMHEKINNTDYSTLYTVNTDGSGLAELVGSKGYKQPAYSYNKIASVTQWGLIEMYFSNLDFSNLERLATTQKTGFTPSFSPDGNNVVYQDTYYNIVKIEFPSKNETILLYGNTNLRNAEPEFSPDGNKIAFTLCEYEIEYLDNGGYRYWLIDADICLYDISSSNTQQLTYNSSIEYSPHFSKDGSKILFASDSDETYQIYSMNLNGSDQRQLTYGPKNHDFGY